MFAILCDVANLIVSADHSNQLNFYENILKRIDAAKAKTEKDWFEFYREAMLFALAFWWIRKKSKKQVKNE